jgi:hypothetical protein
LQFTTGYFYNICTELRCVRRTGASNSLVPWAVAPGAFFFPCASSAQRIRHGRAAVSVPVRRHPLRRSPPDGARAAHGSPPLSGTEGQAPITVRSRRADMLIISRIASSTTTQAGCLHPEETILNQRISLSHTRLLMARVLARSTSVCSAGVLRECPARVGHFCLKSPARCFYTRDIEWRWTRQICAANAHMPWAVVPGASGCWWPSWQQARGAG